MLHDVAVSLAAFITIMGSFLAHDAHQLSAKIDQGAFRAPPIAATFPQPSTSQTESAAATSDPFHADTRSSTAATHDSKIPRLLPHDGGWSVAHPIARSNQSPITGQVLGAATSTSQSITPLDLAVFKSQLEQELNSRILPYPVPAPVAFSGGGAAASPAYDNTFGLSQRIDHLQGTNITDPTITGGSLSNASVAATTLSAGTTRLGSTSVSSLLVSGGSVVSGDLNIGGLLTAASLSVASVASGGAVAAPYFNATSSTASSTFAGNITVGGNASTTNFSASLANVTTGVVANLSAATANLDRFTANNATTTNFFASNFAAANASVSTISATSTTAASVFSYASSTALTAGSLFASTAALTNASTTALSGTNALFTNATSTSLAVTNLANGSILKVNAIGSIVAAIAGADYAAFAYPFVNNATSTNLTLSGVTTITSASTTALSAMNASTTNLTVSSVPNALFLGGANGTTIAYTGTTCTNQFIRSLNGAGIATCASVNLASDITGTLGVANGGTGATNLGSLQLLATDASGNLIATSTPTAANFNATSVSATSTFKGGAVFATGGGNVGIGTASPAAKLDVTTNGGSAGFRVYSSFATYQAGNGGTPYYWDNAGLALNSATGQSYLLYNNGTSYFGDRLYLQSTINWTTLGGSAAQIASPSANVLTISNSGGERLRVTNAGNVGIGTTSPDMLLSVGSNSPSGSVAHFENSTGSCYVNPTTTSLSCSSDARLKTNITALGSTTLDELLALQPVTYNWKTESATTATHTGFIAQQVQPIFPDLISQGPDGYLTMNYAGLTPYLVKAFQDLFQQCHDLAATVASFADRFTTKELTFDRADGADLTLSHELCIGQTCVTEDQLKAILDAAATTGRTNQALPSTSATLVPNGNSPATWPRDQAWTDNLGALFTHDGVAETIYATSTIDTSVAGTTTIDYWANRPSNQEWLHATRDVVVEATANDNQPALNATGTDATSTP